MKNEYSPEDIRALNVRALSEATHDRFGDAYSAFMDANDTAMTLDAADPEADMVRSDTLRDWGMAYARDASRVENPDERQRLFDAAEYVLDRAKLIAEPLVMHPDRYTDKHQMRRGTNTFWVAESVATRVRTLRKAVTVDGPWGDDPGYGAAYAGLTPSYWEVTSAVQPWRYTRAKVKAPAENIGNSKSTLLHGGVWAARTALAVTRTLMSSEVPRSDKIHSVKHVGRMVLSLRSQRAAQESIKAHP